LPLAFIDLVVITATFAGLVFLAAPLANGWERLPARVPTHFGLAGHPDAWGSKTTVLALPAVAVGMSLFLGLLSWFPQIYNYPCQITEQNAAPLYRLGRSMMLWMMAEMVWMFAYLNWMTLRVAEGAASGLGLVPFAFLGAFAATMGVHIALMRAYR